MKISSIIERNEKRVAITPETVKKYINLGFEVILPKNIGIMAGFNDNEYVAAGAEIKKSEIKDADFYVCVKPELTKNLDIKSGAHFIGILSLLKNKSALKEIAKNGINLYALERIPRITRAQAMDVLSSQASLVGYRAVIEAVSVYNKVVPLMITAAGSIRPAKVLVLGAGVAGLQAIATAKRLGAVVSAFDVRLAAKEQVESLGATFVSVDVNESGDGEGGYAREMSDDYKKRQAEKLSQSISTSDIVITTAQIPNKPAPVLVTKAMVESMMAGSVIVDIATESGGNCELSEQDKTVKTKNGVTIIGDSNFAAKIAHDASQLFAKNVFNFVSLMIKSGKIDIADEIVQAALVKEAL